MLAGCVSEPPQAQPTAWVRSELYFGMSRPDGSVVSAEQWQAFVDQQITPRFPEGLTVLSAAGQWRDEAGAVVHEPARVLVVFHPAADGAAATRKLRTLAQLYAQQFDQSAVLLAQSAAQVDFISPPAAAD